MDLIPNKKCASDPVVQAVAANLNAGLHQIPNHSSLNLLLVLTTSTGIISWLTAGWWGSLSDRYGRRTVLFVSVFGLFVTAFTHVITAWFVNVLPGGYWFPRFGFLIEGLCGRASGGMAITHASLADTSNPSTRSRCFSHSLGLLFMGVAVGPALGGLLIRSTGTILSVFYFACVLHGVYTILVLLILPEPLTHAKARGARLRWRQEKAI
ncbi:hypothetical protein OG21DRAFT_346775 [Imleria badia]|nr:hypothetical protein OG21DRAFT_346775 [Imleria badia]